jgi:hypothetical protein
MPNVRAIRWTKPDGEQLDFTETRKPKDTYGRAFTVMFHGEFPALVAQVKSKAALRLLSCLGAYIGPKWGRLNQQKVADDLNVTQSIVNEGLHELLALKVIAKRGAGPTTQWKLITRYFFRGTPSAYRAEQRREIELGLIDLGRICPPIVAEGILRNHSRNKKRSAERRQVEVLTGHAATEDNGKVRLGAIVRNRP